MKKILFVLAIVMMNVCSFGQTNDSTLKLSTYQTSYAYTFNTQDEEIINMSPGQLLKRAGKLKNTAIVVGLISTAATIGITVGCSRSSRDKKFGYIFGGSIGLIGTIACITLEVKSNKLIKEAGKRMTMIEIKGNGVNIKF